MAVYMVEDKKGNKVLVETRTKSGAINHVSKDEYSARTLNTSELVRCIKEGMNVETIGEAEEESKQPVDIKEVPKTTAKKAA